MHAQPAQVPSRAAPRPAPTSFPARYELSLAERGLARWVERQREELLATLRTVGAVLLRGSALREPAAFAEVTERFGGPLGEHYEGPSPRAALAPGVYTASEVWSALTVPEHAEMSYLPLMPRLLYFWCRRAAPHGGATTLVDARRVLARLDADVRELLCAGPLRIRRRHARPRGLHDPFELKRWPAVFGTGDPDELLRRARQLGLSVRIERDGSLTLEHQQPAVRRHPETGEEAWLNHLLVFHRSAPQAILSSALRRERELRAALSYPLVLAYRGLTELGYQGASDVLLSDGAPIADQIVAHVRQVVERESVQVEWRAGDLLIVDNHLALHGRRPFRGPREVIVAWSEARA
jgi:alpha-ketoglutarate-dependent taurine dioxygenase